VPRSSGYKSTLLLHGDRCQNFKSHFTLRTVTDAVFWDVMSYDLVDVYRGFGETCCLHLQGIRLLLYFIVTDMRESEDLTAEGGAARPGQLSRGNHYG
jgi:hypothetical protein